MLSSQVDEDGGIPNTNVAILRAEVRAGRGGVQWSSCPQLFSGALLWTHSCLYGCGGLV